MCVIVFRERLIKQNAVTFHHSYIQMLISSVSEWTKLRQSMQILSIETHTIKYAIQFQDEKHT